MIRNPERRLAAALAAILAACLLPLSASLAQENAQETTQETAQETDGTALTEVLNATTVTFFDELPANDGTVIAESTAAEIPMEEDINDARYVEIALEGQAYLFGVSGGAEGKEVTLVMGVDAPLAGDEPTITLQNAIERLSSALAGDEDALLTSRRMGDVNVITGIYEIGDADPSMQLEAEAGSRLLLIRGGESALHTVDQTGATLGDLTVRTGDTSSPLVTEEGWQESTGDGEAGDDAGLGRAIER